MFTVLVLRLGIRAAHFLLFYVCVFDVGGNIKETKGLNLSFEKIMIFTI